MGNTHRKHSHVSGAGCDICMDTMVTMSPSHQDNESRPAPSDGPDIDSVNKRIIALLQENGRRSYVSIAKEIGLSEAAVRLRTQRMLDEGIMQIVAVTDPMDMGFHRQAMVGVTVIGDIERVADELRAVEGIDYVVVTTGRYDILAEVYARDDDALLQVVNKGMRRVEGVARTEIFSYLKLVSQRYDWGVV